MSKPQHAFHVGANAELDVHGRKLQVGVLQVGGNWGSWTTQGDDRSLRAAGDATEIAVQLLGELLRARVPSAVEEKDFARAIARLALDGDGDRMTKLAFYLAD